MITHIDDGLVFLGWHIQRHRKRGTDRHYIYTYHSRKAVKAAMDKVRTWCRELDINQPLDALLLNSTGNCGAGAHTSGPGSRTPPSTT
ncbi:hypothetical protein ABGB16_22055 [Micromonospora sp. B11E3]|uniref:hypothetical protein n=1 Tax=Micromonospora sp. B11E3 TaxID=3153562 RepID=UPI00325E1042